MVEPCTLKSTAGRVSVAPRSEYTTAMRGLGLRRPCEPRWGQEIFPSINPSILTLGSSQFPVFPRAKRLGVPLPYIQIHGNFPLLTASTFLSIVGIATRYELDRLGIEFGRGRDFPHLSRTALGPTQLFVEWESGPFPGDKADGAWH
jgi:hypothetical protein